LFTNIHQIWHVATTIKEKECTLKLTSVHLTCVHTLLCNDAIDKCDKMV